MRKLLSASFVAFCSLLGYEQASGQTINTFTGGLGGGQATNVGLNNPYCAVADASGNIYVAEGAGHVIRKVTPTGASSIIAGTGVGGYNGDNIAASSAQINGPYCMLLDASGNLYVAEYYNHRVRKIDAVTGIITTVAGVGSQGSTGDWGDATAAKLNYPVGMTFDASGNLYIACYGDGRIRKIDSAMYNSATHVIHTVAGTTYNSNSCADGTVDTLATFGRTTGVAVDASGNIYIAESGNNKIRKVNESTHTVSTFAGGGTPVAPSVGDGLAATSAKLNNPYSIALDASGNMYVADAGNHRIRKIDATNTINTVVGSGTAGYNGDTLTLNSTQLNKPMGVTIGASGYLYISEVTGNRVRKVNLSNNTISTVAGNGATNSISQTYAGYGGDGSAAIYGQLNGPVSVTVDAAGNLYIPESGNYRVRKVTAATGNISTIAGNGTNGSTGEGILATTAQTTTYGVAVDATGNVYLADRGGNKIRKIDVSGVISTVAGLGGTGGYADGAAITTAKFNSPNSVALSPSGNLLYIADGSNNVVRQLNLTTNVVSTIAGGGTPVAPSVGDGGLATSAKLSNPSGLAVDTAGNLYIADYGNGRIRKVDAITHYISTFAGKDTVGFGGDGGLAIAAKLKNPKGLAFDTYGNLYITDYGNNRIRKVNVATGNIYTVVGNGTAAFSGDGGPAAAASIASPNGVAIDATGKMYVADFANSRVRTLTLPSPVIPTVNITKSKSTICTGDTITFTASSTNGGPAPIYQWYKNGAAVGTNSTTYSYVPVNGDSVSCVLTSNDSLTLKATVANGIKLTTHLDTTSVSIAASANNICSGTAVTYTATATNGGTTPVYQWRVNGANAGTGATYNYNPANNDVVSCVLTSNAACRTKSTDTNSVTMNVTALVTPAVNVAASANNICSGTAVNYTATATNGGATPAYQWKVNGTNVGTGTTYNYNPANNDVVSCVLTSNAACTTKPTDTNSVTMNVTTTVTPAVNIAAAQNNICSGTAVTYTATATNGGTTPAYQWTVNGANVGTNADTFSYNPANNDVVNCVLTSNAICASKTNDTSSNVTMVVNPSVTPTVSVIAPAGITVGQQVTFNANVTNGGANPQYQWRKNGADISGATQASYTTTAGTGIQNNDQISVMVTNTDACGNAATSNALNIAISTGINDIGGNSYSVSLYPNPNDGSFTVKAVMADKAQKTVVLEVYNTLGQSIYKEEVAVNNGMIEHQVNLSKALPAGNYFLKLNDGQNSVIRFTLGDK